MNPALPSINPNLKYFYFGIAQSLNRSIAQSNLQARRACERLFDDAGEREAMRVEVAGALQEAVLEDCTFQVNDG